jgi:protein RecA
MDNERKKKLLETMKQFNKSQKEEILFFGDEIENQELISTGLSFLDNYLGGGIKRGTHTILWGDYSTGKTSLALQIIGNAQKEGKLCAYINLEKPVDQERFEAMGVNLKELIRADCTKNAEQALTIIKTLCKEKVIDLIVIDSIQSLSPKAENENKGKERELDEKTMAELARTMSEFCRRVNPDVYKAKAGIIWIGQLRTNIGSFYSGAILSGGNAIKFYAYQIVFMRKGQQTDAPCQKFKTYWLDPEGKLRYETVSEAIGHDCVLRMDKTNSSKSVKEKVEKHFAFLANKGFVDNYDSNADIQIRIDPEAPEPEQEKIKEMMIEKGILENNDNLIITDTSEELGKIKNDYNLEDELKKAEEEGEKQADESLKKVFDKPKKKRGRKPKNEK